MLTSERSNGNGAVTVKAAAAPRIAPVHDPVDRRNSDLSFKVDTGGRPCFRVLIARERSLFASNQAGARNASNFYDSLRDGLQPWDGPPCFYLVPRSVLSALLPASKLYYTLIAYEDREGTRAVYAHPPESLATKAPEVKIALAAGSLGLMFGTPLNRLLQVNSSVSWQQAQEEEVGEDLEVDSPAVVGLADEYEDEEAAAEAAAADADAEGYDAEGHDAEGYAADEAGEDLLGTEAAALGDDEYEDGYGPDSEAQAAGDDEDARRPLLEGSDAMAFADDEEWEDAPAAGGGSSAYGPADDDYDDGFGGSDAASGPASYSAFDHDERHYGAESDDAEAFGGGRSPVPEMLPDEEEDAQGAAQAGEYDDDDVEIEGPTQAQSFAAPEPSRRPLDIEACKAILARIMPFESGSERFGRVVADGEFSGRFGTTHPAYQRFHLGLTFGAFPFVQEKGTLGQLLVLMRSRARDAFDAIFGPHADELIATTTSDAGPRAWESADGLSPRLRPVGGAVLWQEPWLSRFREAAKNPLFQGAQNELAARLYVQPILPIAARLGLDSDQALTILVDRAVQMGPDDAIAWILAAVTPLQSPAQRQQALRRLGHEDLRSFQTSQRLPDSGTWDAPTHAAVIAALRGRPDSPVPVAPREQMIDALVRHAERSSWAERTKRLRAAASADRVFEL